MSEDHVQWMMSYTRVQKYVIVQTLDAYKVVGNNFYYPPFLRVTAAITLNISNEVGR